MIQLPRSLVISLIVLLGTPQIRAQTTVEITLIEGTRLTGQWSATSQAGQIAIETSGKREVFSCDELMSLRFLDHVPSTQANDWRVTVWCIDGSVYPAEILEGGEDRLVIKTPFADNIEISFDQLAAIRWNRHGLLSDMLKEKLASRDPTHDTLLTIKEGKLRVFEGSIKSLSGEGGVFVFRGRSVKFVPSKTFAVVLAGGSAAQASSALCRLGQDYMLAGSILQTAEDSITYQCLNERAVVLAVPLMKEITFKSDRLVYLSDLEPAKIVQRNMFDINWPVVFDQAVSRQPMSMNGRRFTKGIGVHAHCEITYEIAGEYRMLATTIGVDDFARPGGHVIFRVIGDGRELFNSGPLTGNDEPRDITVSLKGIHSLTLIVGQAAGVDIGDHADWANVRIIK